MDGDRRIMIAIIDYGVGNLFSLKSSFAAIGREAVVTSDEKILHEADHIILPGVGAFGDAAAKLRECGMDRAVLKEAASGKPLLGICVGMQMLFDKDYEFGEFDGLGLVPGEVRSISEVIDPALKIPQIGWNALQFKKESRLFDGIREGDFVYFVHSYAAFGCERDTTAVTEYSAALTAAVEKGNVYGTQFHPEKSGKIGLKILDNFCRI